MRKALLLATVLALGLGGAAPAIAANDLGAILDAREPLSLEEAASALARRSAGADVDAAVLADAVLAFERFDDAAPEARDAVTRAFVTEAVDARLRAIGASLFTADGELDPATVRGEADLLGAVSGVSATAVRSLARALERPQEVWNQETWDTYGLVLTGAYLLAAEQGTPLSAWFLPNNLRPIATHVALSVVGPVSEGDIFNGRIWLRVDLDLLLGVAFDHHGVTDSLMLHFPASILIELSWRCCWSFALTFGEPATPIASDVHYVFAYPQTSGEFATRVTGMDLFQSLYDRLGVLNNRAPRDPHFEPVAPDGPSAGDLTTQAPVVSYFGLQLDPEFPDPRPHVRVRPRAFTLDVEGVRAPLASTGPTAGFHSAGVRAWQLNILISRWHNAGTATVGAPGLPASFYYDVPGSYLSGSRMDPYGAVYFADYALAAGVPLG